MKKKICVVTGSRAEYGLMRNTLNEIASSSLLDLALLVTGSHLSREFGYTIDEIKRDGFDVTETIEMLLSSDSPSSIGKSVGLGVIGFTDALKRLSPDIMLVVGDRYEIFAAVTAAMVLNIPIAHISGGEITEGAIDEQIRHAITKMSHIHFTTAEENSIKVKQMGEEAWRVHTVGGLWVDNIKSLKKISRDSMRKKLGIQLNHPTILVTYHSVTLQLEEVDRHIDNLLNALDETEAEIIFTYPNADAGGRVIISKINEFIANRPNAKAVKSLGSLLYHNLLSYVDLVVGNSSSGMVETQSFKLPAVNIGDRQKGRLVTANIISVADDKDAILKAIRKGLSRKFRNSIKDMANPYEKGGAAKKIVQVLSHIPSKNELLIKKFVSISKDNI